MGEWGGKYVGGGWEWLGKYVGEWVGKYVEGVGGEVCSGYMGLVRSQTTSNSHTSPTTSTLNP